MRLRVELNTEQAEGRAQGREAVEEEETSPRRHLTSRAATQDDTSPRLIRSPFELITSRSRQALENVIGTLVRIAPTTESSSSSHVAIAWILSRFHLATPTPSFILNLRARRISLPPLWLELSPSQDSGLRSTRSIVLSHPAEMHFRYLPRFVHEFGVSGFGIVLTIGVVKSLAKHCYQVISFCKTNQVPIFCRSLPLRLSRPALLCHRSRGPS